MCKDVFFFEASFVTFLAVSVFRKFITLLNIHVNLKLGLLENYDTKP